MYRKSFIGAPWQGWNNSQPALTLPPNSFKQITNWMQNKGRLFPFPKSTVMPALPVNESVLAARTFLDGVGDFHTVLLTMNNAFYLIPGPAYTLIPPSPFSGSGNPLAVEVYQNQLFWSDGQHNLSYIKGDANFYDVGTAVVGACFFLGKLAAHLMAIYTVENQQGFPNRVRWSASGDAAQWDPTIDFTAGFADIADVEDQLTGWATIGVTGYAFRNNGITVFSPTGVPGAPFYLENFSIGPTGIGCAYPYSLASYGNFCCFAALDDIYYFDGQAPQRIGGKAKRSIFSDILNSSSVINSAILGTLTAGVDWLSYWIFCPQSNDTFTSVWVYHFDSQEWLNLIYPYGALRSVSNLALS